MSGHTPGPWTVEDNAIMASVGAHICTVSTSDDFPCLTESDDKTEAEVRSDCDIECEANARLIAAAPDLLTALSELLHAYSEPDRRLCCDGRDCGCMGATAHQEAEHYARKAIAKAEGRS